MFGANTEDRRTKLRINNVKLTAVNGTDIPQIGFIDMPVQFENSEWVNTRFYVCQTDGPAILSCSVTEKLGIIQVSDSCNISVVQSENCPIPDCGSLQTMYPECFKEIGHLPGKFHIELKENAEPVIAAPRKYPILLKEEICAKLNEMVELGVIAKCDDEQASDWVNSLAFSRKSSGELRVCLDSKHLNEAIKRTRSYHKTPTLEEISHKLHGATIFSKLDAKHGYWGIELDDESSNLCTFQSPVGKYRFLRLPLVESLNS